MELLREQTSTRHACWRGAWHTRPAPPASWRRKAGTHRRRDRDASGRKGSCFSMHASPKASSLSQPAQRGQQRPGQAGHEPRNSGRQGGVGTKPRGAQRPRQALLRLSRERLVRRCRLPGCAPRNDSSVSWGKSATASGTAVSAPSGRRSSRRPRAARNGASALSSSAGTGKIRRQGPGAVMSAPALRRPAAALAGSARAQVAQRTQHLPAGTPPSCGSLRHPCPVRACLCARLLAAGRWWRFPP